MYDSMCLNKSRYTPYCNRLDNSNYIPVRILVDMSCHKLQHID